MICISVTISLSLYIYIYIYRKREDGTISIINGPVSKIHFEARKDGRFTDRIPFRMGKALEAVVIIGRGHARKR